MSLRAKGDSRILVKSYRANEEPLRLTTRSIFEEANFVDAKIQELVAIGAAVASSCQSCLVTHVELAREAGANGQEIDTAVNIARAVRLQAVTGFDDNANQILRGDVIPVMANSGSGCGPGCQC